MNNSNIQNLSLNAQNILAIYTVPVNMNITVSNKTLTITSKNSLFDDVENQIVNNYRYALDELKRNGNITEYHEQITNNKIVFELVD